MIRSRKQVILLWFLAGLLYFGVYGYNLQVPHEMYYDEVYFAKTAQQITHLNGYVDTAQPPFGKILIAISILIFGDHSWSWRLVSLACGFGCLIILYEITRILTHRDGTAFLAAFLFSLDGVSMTQARIAMLNAPMYFLMLLSVWCLIKHAVTHEWGRQKTFFLSAVFLGLSIATRLVGPSIAAVLLIFYLKVYKEEENKRLLIRDTFFYFIFIVFIFYESSYLILPFIKGFDWSFIWKQQVHMIKYHLLLHKGHLYGSPWWSWPLMMRPIWYYYKAALVEHVSMIRGILCIGNPFIFWLSPIVMIYSVIQLMKHKTLINQVIVVGFFTQWLQWALVTRVKFFHYIYTAIPFAIIGLAMILVRIWDSGKAGKVIVGVYLTLVAAMFVYWYPLYNGMSIPETYFRQHMWFRSWI